jgi:hypothetical protein
LYPTIQNPWGFIDSRNPRKLDSPPSRNWLLIDLLKHLDRTSPEGDKGNPHPVEPIQMAIGRELGIKDQFLRKFPCPFLPELDESKDLLILLALSQLSIGIAEDPLLGILGQESQNPLLTAAPLSEIMFFHQSVFSVKGNGMKVQIERTSPQKSESSYGIKPQPHQARIRSRINPTAIVGKKRSFGDDVESSKQSQPLIQDIAHDMAVSSTSKQFESQKGKDRLRSRDHLCPREPRLFKQLLQRDLSQIRNKQVQPPELGPKSPERKIQPVHIGNLCDLGARPRESLLISSSRQPGKPFVFENQRDGNSAYPLPALFQDLADIIDGKILLSQCDDLVSDTVSFRRSLRSLLRGKEEGAIWMLTELMGEHTKASRRISEAAGDFARRKLLDEVGPESFVLAVGGICGFEKEAGHVC